MVTYSDFEEWFNQLPGEDELTKQIKESINYWSKKNNPSDPDMLTVYRRVFRNGLIILLRTQGETTPQVLTQVPNLMKKIQTSLQELIKVDPTYKTLAQDVYDKWNEDEDYIEFIDTKLKLNPTLKQILLNIQQEQALLLDELNKDFIQTLKDSFAVMIQEFKTKSWKESLTKLNFTPILTYLVKGDSQTAVTQLEARTRQLTDAIGSGVQATKEQTIIDPKQTTSVLSNIFQSIAKSIFNFDFCLSKISKDQVPLCKLLVGLITTFMVCTFLTTGSALYNATSLIPSIQSSVNQELQTMFSSPQSTFGQLGQDLTASYQYHQSKSFEILKSTLGSPNFNVTDRASLTHFLNLLDGSAATQQLMNCVVSTSQDAALMTVFGTNVFRFNQTVIEDLHINVDSLMPLTVTEGLMKEGLMDTNNLQTLYSAGGKVEGMIGVFEQFGLKAKDSPLTKKQLQTIKYLQRTGEAPNEDVLQHLLITPQVDKEPLTTEEYKLTLESCQDQSGLAVEACLIPSNMPQVSSTLEVKFSKQQLTDPSTSIEIQADLIQTYMAQLTARCDSSVVGKMGFVDTVEMVKFLTQSDKKIDLEKVRTESPRQTQFNTVTSMIELLQKIQEDQSPFAMFIKQSYTQGQIPEAISKLKQQRQQLKPQQPTKQLKTQVTQLARKAIKPYANVGVNEEGEYKEPTAQFDLFTVTNTLGFVSVLLMLMIGNILAREKQYPTSKQVILGSVLIGLFITSQLYQAHVPISQYNQVEQELLQTYANVEPSARPMTTLF